MLVTWATVYILNRIHWPEVKSHAIGCNDMEHCTSHGKFLSGMLATLLWAAVAFAALNATAFSRWGVAFFALTLCAVLFYGKPYVAPYLGLAS
ncbi:conserved protein of unknown function [Burkholderia multivorans]